MKELINLQGLGKAGVEKLNSAGIFDLLGLAVQNPASLSEITGVSVPMARKLIAKAKEELNFTYETGDVIDKRRKEMIKISTGCKPIDDMMGGGFESGSITEVYAEFSAGKTQLAHYLCCKTLKDYPDAIVYYVDTEGCFRPERIRDFCEGLEMDPDDTLKKIRTYKVFNFEHQVLTVEELDKTIAKNKENVKLIIVDSIAGYMRLMSGRGQLAERQQILNKHIHQLDKMADVYNCCVFITNQVMSNPGGYGLSVMPVGGNILGHNVSSRIYLRKGTKDSRVAKLVDSPHLPISDASFTITKTGIEEFEK